MSLRWKSRNRRRYIDEEMGKHRGKETRRSATGRRKEDARWMKLISKNEVISDVVRIAPLPRAFLAALPLQDADILIL